MKWIKALILSVLLAFSIIGKCQEYLWVQFTDKKDVQFDANSYFDTKALERRAKSGIPIDSTDFPVNESYLAKISEIVDSVGYSSRWMNAVFVKCRTENIQAISDLPFVEKIFYPNIITFPTEIIYSTQLSPKENDLLNKQLESMKGSAFIENNYDGKGIRIAVFDVGFLAVDKSPIFEHLFKDSLIISTFDFTRNKENVFNNSEHGTLVLSCIGGKLKNKRIGLATGAEFLLAITEQNRETIADEQNWLAAAEWADKNGAHIINSSLGYTYHRYFPDQLDGKSSLIAKAAQMATEKGILVINSAGNDGNNNWKHISTPADAENVLTIGAIKPSTGIHATYSSKGPTADNRMKPDLVAYGSVIAAGEKNLKKVSGTSFAAPLITGFAACAWQSDTSLNNMTLFRKLRHCGDLFPYYDYSHGFGVPQANNFLFRKEKPEITFSIFVGEDSIYIEVKKEFIISKLTDKYNHFYYHISTANGVLDRYYVIDVYQTEVLRFGRNEFSEGQTIRMHYKGYTATWGF